MTRVAVVLLLGCCSLNPVSDLRAAPAQIAKLRALLDATAQPGAMRQAAEKQEGLTTLLCTGIWGSSRLNNEPVIVDLDKKTISLSHLPAIPIVETSTVALRFRGEVHEPTYDAISGILDRVSGRLHGTEFRKDSWLNNFDLACQPQNPVPRRP